MIKVGIIGCGKMADQHVIQIQRIAGAEIAGVCDKEPLMAQDMSERFKVGKYFADVQEMLEAIKPEVVVAAGSEVRHDIELDGNGMRLVIELELGSVQLIGAVMLIPEQVSASSLAELEKLASTQAKSQSLVTAHGRTTIEFLAVTPGNYTVCTVLANSPSTIADPRAITPTVGCSSAVVATSPRAQRLSIAPRLPN